MDKLIKSDKPFGNTLVIGVGPAGINVAVNVSRGWCCKIGLLNRKGNHAKRLKKELIENDYMITLKMQGEQHINLSGKVKVDYFYEGYENIDNLWQTLIICTPSDSYRDVIEALDIGFLKEIKTIILLSPAIGSNLLLNSLLKKAKSKIDLISFSTYYGATKYYSKASILTVFTKALKKKIYIASSKKDSKVVFTAQLFIESLGIQCIVNSNTVEVESKNVTTYVHPPFFINEFSLDQIFNSRKSKKSMYKIYPEGPITQHTIKTMVLLWKEICNLIQCFSAKPLNLLKFLNDDNYPVHEITLSRQDIEGFMEFDQIKQEYLLYIRYSSIIIDPFSKPDHMGRYFDFSAVPYKQVYKNGKGRWVIPRIPYEDYMKLSLVYGLGKKMKINMPQALELIELFEDRLERFIKEMGIVSVNPESFISKTQNDIDAIISETGL